MSSAVQLRSPHYVPARKYHAVKTLEEAGVGRTDHVDVNLGFVT
jgi:hypothetical protein